MILEDFFVNFSILCTGIFLIHLCFRRESVSSKSFMERRISKGVLYGLFGVVLMHFGIHLKGGLLIDLRSIPMMIAAQVGGWVSTLVATIIIITCRLTFYPISYSSLVNVVVLTLAGTAFSFISYSSMKREQKWLFMTISFIAIIGSSIHFIIPEWKKGFTILVQYVFAVASGTIMTHLLTSYLWRFHDNYLKLKEDAQKDYLTGLNNARSFDYAINSAFSKAMEHKEDLSLLLIDIDYFKQVNDTYGHPAGDAVLKQLGLILVQSCRSVDIVSRNGGEEFSIILPACDSTTARSIANRIRTSVEQSVFVVNENVELKITVSIGYSTINHKNNIFVEQLIRQADEGLYTAKQTGRNRISRCPHFESRMV
ncbi:diguanylate cyclase [Ectobacillus panaciterrae]|uniref:GGDEF domain-containing protein n=1 Tax=Ectobacillus panaciterrae TaxID=363872 RepID=UPI000403C2E6